MKVVRLRTSRRVAMSRFILLFKEIAIENFRLLLLSIMMVLVIGQFTQARSQWGDILKGAKKSLGVGGGVFCAQCHRI